MTKARSTLTKVGTALAFTALSTTLVAQPAAAHSGTYYKSRSGCVYTGGFSYYHDYAYTRKDAGGCTGHAWLRVQRSNGTYWEGHYAGFISVSTADYGMIHAWHKTQSGESWVASH
jgi:hypothetical protein